MATPDDKVNLWRVFLPDPTNWLTSMDAGLFWIFQWDWIIIALCNTVPAIVAIYDMHRLLPDLDSAPLLDRLFKGLYLGVALTIVGGPGAALAGVWGWREEQLVIIEERAAAESAKKAS